MLANVNLPGDLEALCVKGRILVIGSRGPVVINPRDLMLRNAQIMGMVLYNAGELELRSVHAMLGAGLANKTLRPVVGKEIALKNASLAHEMVMAPGAYGKIVLIP
jgi:NADPH2:quinone reductase